MKIENFYDKETATFTYIVIDEESGNCAIIDPVMDFDIFSGKISYNSCQKIIDFVQQNSLTVQWILETHVHADHLTGSAYLKEKLGGKIAIGAKILDVLYYWVGVFNNAENTALDGSQFDHLFQDNEIFTIGNLQVKVMHTPGHTPACICYLVEDAIFVGDTIFSPKIGTARTDFKGGSAATLYDSIQKILQLPKTTKIFLGHDYPENNFEPTFCVTVGEQKLNNVLINDKISKETYVENRNKRDIGKAVPKLLYPALQVNLRAGKFGKAEKNGKNYIKIPVSE